MPGLSFAQIGSIYNTMADELIGGVSPLTKPLILNQIKVIQQGMQTLINNGTFDGFNDPNDGNFTKVHAQNIADQMSFLTKVIGGSYGTNTNAPPKYVNDVVRDVQDIVAGDDNLAALAAPTKGFQQVSHLLTPPTPFPDTPFQTQTLLQFISDANSLAERGVAAIGMDPNSDVVKTLIADINTVGVNISDYSKAQGGVFAARFNNEFTSVELGQSGGVHGTASNELIQGLQTGDANLIKGAATVMMANAADVRGNMLVAGDVFTPAPNGGIPAVVDTVHVAGQVFDDAVTKLLGGIYDGNKTSIVNDLNAAKTGLQAAIGTEHITGASLAHLKTVIGLLGQEAADVAAMPVNPTPVSFVANKIGLETAGILGIINHDATLTNLADGAFVPLPPATNGLLTAGGPGPGPGNKMAAIPATPAIPAEPAIPAIPGQAPATPAIKAIPATPATPAVPTHTDVAALGDHHLDFQQMGIHDLAHMWHA